MKKEYRVMGAHKDPAGFLVRWRVIKYPTLEEAKAVIEKQIEIQKTRHGEVVSWNIASRDVTPWEEVDSYKKA